MIPSAFAALPRGIRSTTTGPPNPVAPFFFDDFGSGDLSHAQGGAFWRSRVDDGSRRAVVTDVAMPGDSHSLRITYQGVASCLTGWNNETDLDLGRQVRELWIEHYIRYADGVSGGGARYYHRWPTVRNANGTCSSETNVSANNKAWRCWGGAYDTGTTGARRIKVGAETRPTVTPGDSRYYLMATPGGVSSILPYGTTGTVKQQLDPAITDNTPGTMRRGVWTRQRIHIRLSSSPTAQDGEMSYTCGEGDTAQRLHFGDLDLWAPDVGGGAQNYLEHFRFLGSCNSGFSQTTHTHFARIALYVTSPGWD